MIVHTVTLPAYSFEPSCQVSLPNSPFCGIGWNVHRTLPVRASNARIQPGICSFVLISDEIAAGVITMSLTTIGGDCTE